jgi:DNA-binding transcriptional LysR family regulator
MWEDVELREIRAFLVLAEELHFRRSAEKLGVTQARISQVLRELERKLGQRLVHRTSRQVALTPAGEQFRDLIGPACDQLSDVLRRYSATSETLVGTLRVGIVAGPSGGSPLMAAVDKFAAAYPGCTVDFRDVSLADILGPLRHGDVDVLTVRLPLDQPDLVIGPTLSREPRVLAVNRDHPLARRSEVSIEDVADYKVGWFDTIPKELEDAILPSQTPSGRQIERLRRPIRNLSELAMLVARGDIVHLAVPSMVDYWGPDIAYVPVTDMPESSEALVWLRSNPDTKIREFARIARETLGGSHGQPSETAS